VWGGPPPPAKQPLSLYHLSYVLSLGRTNVKKRGAVERGKMKRGREGARSAERS